MEEVDLGDCWRDRITRAMKPLLFGKIHSYSKSSAVNYIHHGVDGLHHTPRYMCSCVLFCQRLYCVCNNSSFCRFVEV